MVSRKEFALKKIELVRQDCNLIAFLNRLGIHLLQIEDPVKKEQLVTWHIHILASIYLMIKDREKDFKLPFKKNMIAHKSFLFVQSAFNDLESKQKEWLMKNYKEFINMAEFKEWK